MTMTASTGSSVSPDSSTPPGSAVPAGPVGAGIPEPGADLTKEAAPALASRLRQLLAKGASNIGWFLVGLVVVVAAWQFAATQASDVPSPVDSGNTLLTMLADPFYDKGPNDKGVGLQLLISLQRVFLGFTLAALVGVPVGLLLGGSRRAWSAFNPVVQVLRPVSPLAWFPIWLVILKNGPLASVFVIFITALWPTVINTAAGISDIPVDQRNVARVFRFGRLAYLRHVLIPNALPSIITGLRLSMGIAWMVIVAVEMLSGNSGIGYFVWNAYNGDQLTSVVAAIVFIGLIGFVLDSVLLRLSRRFAIEGVQT